MIKENIALKAYFYNGFDEPKLIATSSEGLKDLAISDTYLGDCTEDYLEDLTNCIDIDDLSEQLSCYDIFINPTKAELVKVNKSWFDADKLETHLDNWRYIPARYAIVDDFGFEIDCNDFDSLQGAMSYVSALDEQADQQGYASSGTSVVIYDAKENNISMEYWCENY